MLTSQGLSLDLPLCRFDSLSDLLQVCTDVAFLVRPSLTFLIEMATSLTFLLFRVLIFSTFILFTYLYTIYLLIGTLCVPIVSASSEGRVFHVFC